MIAEHPELMVGSLKAKAVQELCFAANVPKKDVLQAQPTAISRLVAPENTGLKTLTATMREIKSVMVTAFAAPPIHVNGTRTIQEMPFWVHNAVTDYMKYVPPTVKMLWLYRKIPIPF